jgi:hypothetical protein
MQYPVHSLDADALCDLPEIHPCRNSVELTALTPVASHLEARIRVDLAERGGSQAVTGKGFVGEDRLALMERVEMARETAHPEPWEPAGRLST